MRRAVLVVFALVFALAGCAALADLGELRQDLRAEGYEVSGLSHNTMNGHDVLTLTATSDSDDAERIAEIVWTKYPAEVDQLVVTLNGTQALDLSADELTEKFGERPESLGPAAENGGPNITVIVVAVVGSLLLVALVVVVWLRGRRPPPPSAPPGPVYVPQPYPAPPQPPQYPG